MIRQLEPDPPYGLDGDRPRGARAAARRHGRRASLGPNEFASQTASMMCSCYISVPGSSAEELVSRSILGRSATSMCSRRTAVALWSTVSRGQWLGARYVLRCWMRRATAIRAITSLYVKGLET